MTYRTILFLVGLCGLSLVGCQLSGSVKTSPAPAIPDSTLTEWEPPVRTKTITFYPPDYHFDKQTWTTSGPLQTTKGGVSFGLDDGTWIDLVGSCVVEWSWQ